MIVTIPPFPRECNPNARAHWAAKAKARAKLREWARIAATAAKNEGRRLGLDGFPWRAATVKVVRYGGKRMDPDNLIASMKAAIDGTVDAGILEDDSGLTWLPPEQKPGKPKVEIHLERTDA